MPASWASWFMPGQALAAKFPAPRGHSAPSTDFEPSTSHDPRSRDLDFHIRSLEDTHDLMPMDFMHWILESADKPSRQPQLTMP